MLNIIQNHYDIYTMLADENFSSGWFMMTLALNGQKMFCQKHVFLDYIAYSFAFVNGKKVFSEFCTLLCESCYFDKWLRKYKLWKFDNCCDFIDYCLDRWTKTSYYDYVKGCGLNYCNYSFFMSDINFKFNCQHIEEHQDMALQFWLAIQNKHV